MYHVSENIKYLRAKQSLSQNQLAVKLRLTRNQINCFENGISQPSIEALQKIATFFEIKIDTLINIEIHKDNLNAINELDEKLTD